MKTLKNELIKLKNKSDTLVFVFDIDGTIVKRSNKIDERILYMLKMLDNKGAKIGIATGRPLCKSTQILETIKISFPSIFLDGQVIINMEHNIINKTELEIPNLKAITERYANNYFIFFEDENYIYSFSVMEQLMYTLAFRYKRRHIKVVNDDIEIKPLRLYLKKKVGLISDENILELNNICGTEKNIIFLGDEWIVIQPKEMDKSIAMDIIINKYSYSYEQIIFFGNGINDLNLLKKSAIGIAMENSDSEVIPYANYITGHIDEAGVCEALKIILNVL